jgi:hypothetical protein
MYIIDDDRDQIMHYIDWNLVSMLAWEHNGHANFYEDYSGNTSFLKMHGSSFRIHDLRLNWENPFLFFDTDGDKLTEGAIRFVNTPTFRPKENNDPLFNTMDTAVDIHFNGLMDYAAVTWDLDNDNGPGNEFDFDMSLLFRGRGFDYRDQVHRFKSLRGLGPQTDHLLYDARWRQLTELVYPDRDTAWHMIYNRGQWSECRLVFDEDDDCNRWERVEFYDPKDPFVIGREKGGLDHNQQADAAGDRGEFDLDCSGKGQLYVGAFDGRIHLYGAEWGAWRMDQTAYSYQGFGGIYNRWRPGRLQKEPEKFATVKYEDTDNNGFMDKLLYDLDGDKRYEDSVSLLALGLSDRQPLFGGQGLRPGADAQQRFAAVANGMWARAQQAVAIARQQGIETSWYNFYLQPHSLHEKYDFGYWLGFYLYRDLRDHFARHGNKHLLTLLDKAYYSGNWNLLKQKL